MANDFIWKNIPEQLKERVDITILWKDIPGQLNKLLKEMALEKPECYKTIYPEGHSFSWNAILTQLKQFTEFVECTEPTEDEPETEGEATGK